LEADLIDAVFDTEAVAPTAVSAIRLWHPCVECLHFEHAATVALGAIALHALVLSWGRGCLLRPMLEHGVRERLRSADVRHGRGCSESVWYTSGVWPLLTIRGIRSRHLGSECKRHAA